MTAPDAAGLPFTVHDIGVLLAAEPGTCTVLVDGEAFSSCLLLTAMLDGSDVRTAEGLPAEAGAEMSRVQRAFAEAGAYQCSYCIPGMVLTVSAALETQASATAEDLCEELGGNLCRCGSYPRVRAALRALTAGRPEEPPETEEATSP